MSMWTPGPLTVVAPFVTAKSTVPVVKPLLSTESTVPFHTVGARTANDGYCAASDFFQTMAPCATVRMVASSPAIVTTPLGASAGCRSVAAEVVLHATGSPAGERPAAIATPVPATSDPASTTAPIHLRPQPIVEG